MAHVSVTQNDGTNVVVQDDLEGFQRLRDVAVGLLEKAEK